MGEGADRGIFSTSAWSYLLVFYLYLTFSTSTDLVSTSANLVSTSTDHFLPFGITTFLKTPKNKSQVRRNYRARCFSNYIALYLVQVHTFEHVSTCLSWAKIIKHLVSLLRFYQTILSVINSVCFQMRKENLPGYVLNCKLTQHESVLTRVKW